MGKRRPVGFQICFKAVSLPRASHCGPGDTRDGGNVDTRLGFVILAAAIPGEWPPDRREWDTRPPREGQQRRHLRSAASLLTAEAVEGASGKRATTCEAWDGNIRRPARVTSAAEGG